MPKPSIIDEESVFKLIEEVKKREWIYSNAESARPISRLTMLNSWAEIAAIIGNPEAILKQKWKSLRDTFMKEVKRTGAGPDIAYPGKWRFFDHLTFLYEAQREGEKTESYHDEDSETEEQENLKEEGESVSDCIKSEEDFETVFTEDSLKIESPVPKKRKHEDRFTSHTNDFDVMFLNSLTPYIKQLEPMRKLMVRHKIQELLLDELSAQMAVNKKKSSGDRNWHVIDKDF